MNVTRLVLLAGTLFIAGCQCNTDPQTDDTSPPDAPPERDRGQWLSMGTLADGTIVASYFDRDEDGLGVAFGTMGAEGVEWTYEEVEGFQDASGLDSGNLGTHTSLVVAPGDVVWVVYYDVGNAALRYARRHKTVNAAMEPIGSWITGVADVGGGARPDAGQWASMALSPENKPVVAHYDAGEGELRVTRWDGESWGNQVKIEGEEYTLQDTGGPSKPADVGKFADLFIDAAGTEYIAYYDDAWSRLMLAVGGADGFVQHVVDESADVGQWPSLYVEESGTIHIAYHDVENQDLRYASGTPAGFSVTTVDNGELIGADTEIFMNGDLLSILYFDGQNNDAKLATMAGGAWTTNTLAGDDGTGLGYHNEVVVANGSYYAGCYDYTNRSIWLGALQ